MLKKLFGFDERVTTVRTEVMAGITTFLTMAYILAVNPNILSTTGMDKGALFTTTVLASALTTLLMAFYAKLPFGLAPGMGLNAFFAYSVCLGLGYSWQFALTAVLIEGLIFILLPDAVADKRAHLRKRSGRKALRGKRIIQSLPQIGQRVEQRPVQVKNCKLIHGLILALSVFDAIIKVAASACQCYNTAILTKRDEKTWKFIRSPILTRRSWMFTRG